jgi:hypothetical protein
MNLFPGTKPFFAHWLHRQVSFLIASTNSRISLCFLRPSTNTVASSEPIYQNLLKLFNEVRIENFDCVSECYSPMEVLMPPSVASVCSPIRVVLWSTVSGTTGSWPSLLPLALLSLLKGSGWASSLVGRLSVSNKWGLEYICVFV